MTAGRIFVVIDAGEGGVSEASLVSQRPWGSDGSTTTVTFTIDGNNVPYSGTLAFGGKQFFVRGTAAFAPDLMTKADKREVSVDGKTWMPLAESKSVKAKPSPK